MLSKSRIKANNKYNAKAYDTLNVRIRKDRGGKALVQAAAEAAGESTGVYIMNAVYERMREEGIDVPDKAE